MNRSVGNVTAFCRHLEAAVCKAPKYFSTSTISVMLLWVLITNADFNPYFAASH